MSKLFPNPSWIFQSTRDRGPWKFAIFENGIFEFYFPSCSLYLLEIKSKKWTSNSKFNFQIIWKLKTVSFCALLLRFFMEKKIVSSIVGSLELTLQLFVELSLFLKRYILFFFFFNSYIFNPKVAGTIKHSVCNLLRFFLSIY